WKKTPQQLEELCALQAKLLDAAANVVKPGGTLVYSTCSLEPEENELQAEAFLARHAGWQIEPTPGAIFSDVVSAPGFLQTLPHRHGCDGAFAARFRRES
ncbi:MAG TPA: hypothetical protein VF719_05995, partial [Abditibacteriaceae bacterium]